jgi:hypothetical protein
VPLLLRLLLDDLGKRPVEQQREQEGRRHRFARGYTLIRVLQSAAHQLRHRTARVAIQVIRHRGQQLG